MSSVRWLMFETALTFASLALDIAGKYNDYNEGLNASYNSHAFAQRQSALNNQLAYNAYLNLNEQEQLEYKRNALDQFELQRKIRKAVAYRLAIQGSSQKSGGSAESVLRNIERQGLYSLHRKDLNYEIRLRNLQLQRNNIALEVQSKNNAVYAQIQGAPSATGLALSIGGSALQTGLDWKKGRVPSKSTPTTPVSKKSSSSDKYDFGWMDQTDEEIMQEYYRSSEYLNKKR